MVETVAPVREKAKTRVKQFRLLLGALLACSFALWAKAYAEGATGAPPALLVFGTDPFENEKDLNLRLMAVDALRKQHVPIDQFHVLDENGAVLETFKSNRGLVSKDRLKSTQRLALAVSLSGAEQDLRLPLLLDRQNPSRLRRAFDGFSWHDVDDDYAIQLGADAHRFYPFAGAVSSSLNNPGVALDNGKVSQVELAPHPAEIFDPAGQKLILDRKGYFVTGPQSAEPGKQVDFELVSADSKKYFVHLWLNEELLHMDQLKVSATPVRWRAQLPAHAVPDDALWVSMTPSPWINARGEGHVVRVVGERKPDVEQQLAWLADITNHVRLDDPLREWVGQTPQDTLVDKALQALQARVAPPVYQAPLVAALPKMQQKAFDAVRSQRLETWRKPYRVSALLLSLFVLFWLHLEIQSHLRWKKELQVWMMEETEDPSFTARSWHQRVPWHYLWAFLGFTLISALIWGADWILGLSTVDYRL